MVALDAQRKKFPVGPASLPDQSAQEVPHIVLVTGFTKTYKRRTAARDVDLSIHPGEIYGLIGPDGAGKSSLMKAMAGVLSFDAGKVEVFGISLDSEANAERIKGRIGFMPQGLGLNLYPDLSVEENIDYFARLRLVQEDLLAQRKQRLLAMTRLDRFRARAMRNLSGGMKQKLGLVCTLIHEPELVILDEPTTGVDPVSRRDFWAILAELLAERGMTAIVSTAYLDEASRFHRLALMYGGRVVAEGEPDAIVASVPGTLVTVRAEDHTGAVKRLKELSFEVETIGDESCVFIEDADADAAAAQVREALDGIPLQSIETGEGDLEDVFISLLRRQGVGTSLATEAVEWSQAPAANGDHIAIEAEELSRDFGAFRAADRVSFKVKRGEIFGLLGANGAGKTTVIKMLTGIMRPSSGSGHIAGKDVMRGGSEIKRRIGYVSQAFSLYQDLTVIENIRLYAGIYGLSRAETRERAHWVIHLGDLVGHENDLAVSLPMGLRQRLALGCALVHQPHVLFLDEPTSGVDPVGRRAFWDILFQLSRNEGVTILVTTHYMSEAEHCDHLALMHAGRIVADASPKELKGEVEREAGSVLEIEVDQPASALKLLEAAGYGQPALFGQRIHLLSQHPKTDARRIPAVLHKSGLHADIPTSRPLSMEDVFIYRITKLEEESAAVPARQAA